jgi:beta-galactosidase
MVHISVQTDPTARNRELCPFWGWPEVWPHWNHDNEGDTLAVHVYTNVPGVELFVNGKPMGSKHWDIKQEAFPMWEVPFEKGAIEAMGISSDGDTVKHLIQTAGEPASIVLQPDKQTLKPNRQDLAYVEVQVLEENGILVPFAENKIDFQVEGEGFLRAVGNGNPVSHTPFRGNTMEAFHGKCLTVVQSGGEEGTIRLTAQGEGLEPAVCTIEVK